MVVEPASYTVDGFGAETISEGSGGVCVDHCIAEGVIFEMGDRTAGGAQIFADIAIAVERGVKRRGCAGAGMMALREHPADSARALHGAAEVDAPEAGCLKSGRDARAY